MKISRIAVLLIVAAAGGLVVAHLDAQSGAVASSGPVGVCNVGEILNNCQKTKDLTMTLKKQSIEVQNEAKKRKEEIKNLAKALEKLAPGSEAYALAEAEVQRRTFQSEAWLKFEQDKSMRKHRKLTREIYSDVQKAVNAVAKQRGFKVVLHQQRGALQARRVADMFREISLRTVVYSDQTVDITASVLSALNKAYQRQP